MKKIIKSALAVAIGALATFTASAEEPIITFHTSLYQNQGPINSMSFHIGGTGGGYIDVDFGFGTEEYELEEAVFDSTTSAIKATTISGTVSEEGIVRIYGDASAIDYLSLSGCYINSVEMPELTNLQILDMSHNELTGLDLSAYTRLEAIYLADNPYSEATPLKIGGNKPNLTILEIGQSYWLDQSFNLSDYPSIISFDAYAAYDLRKVDPTGCPKLMQLALDLTEVESLDVSKNPELVILNISDCKITDIDISHNTKLQQFYCVRGSQKYNSYKIKSLDLSHNPELYYLFAGYNALKNLDISNNPKLFDLSVPWNELTTLDISNNKNLYNVIIRNNYFTFATLPVNPGDWGEYDYQQRATPVNRSYKTGDVLDFSATMLREGTETVASMYKVNEEDYSSPIPLDNSNFKFEDGKITLLTELTDSVFIRFDNSQYSQYPISTTNFVVKNDSEYGKPANAITFLPAADEGREVSFVVGMNGASAESPKTFYVDFGDGQPVEMTAAGSTVATGTTVRNNRNGNGYMHIYVPEDNDISALSIDGMELFSIQFGLAARSLHELTLNNTGLYELDLTELLQLRRLELRKNHLRTLDISGKNYLFAKHNLTDLIAPSNQIETLVIEDSESLLNLDASSNALTELDLVSAKQLVNLNMSSNKLTSIDFSKCAALKNVNVSLNSIAQIVMPNESVLHDFDIHNNAMTFATLPLQSAFTGKYTYNNQKPLRISEKGPGVDLSEQYLDLDGNFTKFEWYKADGTKLTEGTDYTESEGKTRFLDSTLGKVYCMISNAGLPALTLRTSQIMVSEMPDLVTVSFTTPVGGEDVSLSLAAEKPTSIFIDWKGDGIDLANYELGTTYRLFSATTTEGANVKVYTYGDEAPISVFSITGATMKDLDISGLTSAGTITVSNASIDNIVLPEGGSLKELNLSGNKLTSIDLSKQPNITSLSLAHNSFTGKIDFSSFKPLQLLSLSNNAISEIVLDNPMLWFLDLAHNNLSEIDLTKVQSLEQLSLAGNEFCNVDVESLRGLKALVLDQNKFTFATLPPVKDQYIIYTYSNQERIDGVVNGLTVDLSSQAMVGSTPTTYSWFIDDPVQDEEGNWTGEQLIVDEEYTVENGVTTFVEPLDRLVCLMLNADFKGLALMSNMIDLSTGAIEGTGTESIVDVKVIGSSIIAVAENATARAYRTDGTLATTAKVNGYCNLGTFTPGIYVVTIGNKAFKVAVR